MPRGRPGRHPKNDEPKPPSTEMGELFTHIPETDSHVAVSKGGDSKGVIVGVEGYKMLRFAQRKKYFAASSELWGKAREHFQHNPNRLFHGRTGEEIERGFISEYVEMMGSFLSFAVDGKPGQYPPDTHDLLKSKRFRGEVALIDYPLLEEDGGKNMLLEMPGMTKVRDVTEINGIPFPRENGTVLGYDRDTGLITKVFPFPDPEAEAPEAEAEAEEAVTYPGQKPKGSEKEQDFHAALYWITNEDQRPPEGTRMILRGYRLCYPHLSGRYNFDATFPPSSGPLSGMTMRFAKSEEIENSK